MSTKTLAKAAKKDAPKKAAQGAPAKAEKKKLEAAESSTVASEDSEAAPAIDLDELEEQEAEAASASSQGGNAEALAAAAGSPTEMSASFKNFRHHPDMENFYRFIYDNDLRHEALAIIDEIIEEKQQRKIVKGAKAQAH